MRKKSERLGHIGWREWVALPALGISWIKAKVDTGARTSALHAWDLDSYSKDGEPWVRFVVHPFQRDVEESIEVHAPVLEQRRVRSSSGRASLRPVILTALQFAALRWQIELTLVSRDEMGFRMLLGRQAIRGRFAVDPGASYHGDRPPREILHRNRRGLREHRRQLRRRKSHE